MGAGRLTYLLLIVAAEAVVIGEEPGMVLALGALLALLAFTGRRRR